MSELKLDPWMVAFERIFNAKFVNVTEHKLFVCPDNCDGCHFCIGGLACCTVCKQGEVELEEYCPGEMGSKS